MTRYSADAATRYAQRVTDGMIPTGELVKLAAQRHLDDLATGKQRGLSYDVALAAETVRFYGLLPHIKGEWARRNEKIHIEDWQAFTRNLPFTCRVTQMIGVETWGTGYDGKRIHLDNQIFSKESDKDNLESIGEYIIDVYAHNLQFANVEFRLTRPVQYRHLGQGI